MKMTIMFFIKSALEAIFFSENSLWFVWLVSACVLGYLVGYNHDILNFRAGR